MNPRRNALGRGLGALISSPPPAPAAPATPMGVSVGPPIPATTASGVLEIEVARIDPNPDQPRREFEPTALQQLADSIRQHGVLQPVVVRQAGSRYELVMGERRFRASQLAGRRSVPAVVLDVDPADRLELAIVENVQRQDLNPIELALAYQALARAGHTQEEIGRKVSMDRSSIANHIRLLDLSRTIQADVEAGRLSMGHAKALLQVADLESREALRARALGEHLTVRATEQAARELVVGGKSALETARSVPPPRKPDAPKVLDPDTRAYLERLERRLQTRVELHPGADGGGKLEIRYFDLEDLDRIGNLLLGLA
ncbi:ParB/RepB/Spo0J family partition protein [Myxococcota bacterium]|nr:ParB/RepB/Spo0J family partition protein [Myxococcota bacterium]